MAVASLGSLLTACSLIPGAGLNEAGDERITAGQTLPQQDGRVTGPTLQALADQARAARAQDGKSGAPASGAIAKSTLQTVDGSKVLTQKNASVAADRLPDPRAAAPGDRHAAALALLARAKSRAAATSEMPGDAARLDEGRPKTYRLDGPAPVAAGAPYANPYQPQQGGPPAPVASYPRSAAFSPPPYAGQPSGFQPPDPAPEAVRPASDPKALMEAVERLRARQVVQPARVEAGQPDATGSVPAPAGAEFTPATPLTFIQFEKGSVTLPVSGQKSVAALVQPFLKQKGAKLVMAVGLGGEGEAYVRLLHANQRAQAVSQQVPPGFEVIRRFDPALPNESVRMFVVNSER
ncbi:MAG: hypothetical protein K2P80_01205 [Beijerinckiaceae bacterium]|nr:hypothetical protein [Beijerinckiaceae bacterium]